MKVVVTGTSGQVGSYLLEHFSKEHDAVGIDVRPCPYPESERLTKRLDIFKERDLSSVMKGADWVIHCAAQVSVERSMKEPVADAENNVLGTVNLLWNSFMHEARNFIFISSAAVYGNPVRVPVDEEHPTSPMSPYGASKLCGEKYCLAFANAYGLSVSIVRPFNIYSKRSDPKSPYSGVITKFVGWAKEGSPLIIEGDGKQTRDFVHMSDVIRLIDLIVKKRNLSTGRTFNCGTGKSSTIIELAKVIQSNAPGKKPEIKHIQPRPGDIKNSCADIKLSQDLLGYFPKISLEQGISELLK